MLEKNCMKIIIGSMDSIANKFSIDIAKIFDYLTRGYEIRARGVFNEVKKQYSKDLQPGTDLENAVEIFVLLDEYLNEDAMGDDFSEKKNFLLSAYEDFLGDSKSPAK